MIFGGQEGCRDCLATKFVQEWRMSWRAIPDLQIIAATDTAPIVIMNIHAEKVQQDGSASGLGDSVNAVCIVWVIAWVRR